MILDIKGNIKPYYVQTLAMIFFPGVKFPENEPEETGTLKAEVKMSGTNGEISADVVIRGPGGNCSGHASRPVTDFDGDRDLAEKAVCGEAFIKAGREYTGITPPWGILTGVRPAKVATDLLERGFDAESASRRLQSSYLVTPDKADMAVNVALAEKRIITDEARRNCSVYIGIPFCPSRCAYCSFVSYTSPKLLALIPDYLEVLKSDISNLADLISGLGMDVKTVYIGGGTPTVLDGNQLESLLDCVGATGWRPDEFTLEAGRPDTITKEKLMTAAARGVTRVSVNPQSLNDDVLKAIGRKHDTKMFYEAYDLAKSSGIRDINVDLIAGLPGDTVESFRATVDGVIALDPTNITVHTFSVKKSADFRQEGRYDAGSVTAAASVEYSQKALQESGYLPYYMYRQKNTVGNLENVGYAKPGHEGLYNIYMMEEVHSIFAAGASSVTKLVSLPDSAGDLRIERLFQPKYPYEYLDEWREGEKQKRTDSLKKTAEEFFGGEIRNEKSRPSRAVGHNEETGLDKSQKDSEKVRS